LAAIDDIVEATKSRYHKVELVDRARIDGPVLAVGQRGSESIYDDDLHQTSGASSADDHGCGVTYTSVIEAADELASDHVVCD
jgi:hypothetical protein